MEAVRKVIYHTTAALFAVILLILGASVVMRYIFNDSIIWAEEIMRFAFIWMFFLSMSEVSRNGAHLALDLVPSLIRGTPRKIMDVMIECLSISFLLVLLWYSWQIALRNMAQKSPALLIPYGCIYMAIPAGCVLMALFSGQRIYWLLTGTVPAAPAREEAE